MVDANPSDVEFKWTFNNSAESIDVATNHVTRSGRMFIFMSTNIQPNFAIPAAHNSPIIFYFFFVTPNGVMV